MNLLESSRPFPPPLAGIRVNKKFGRDALVRGQSIDLIEGMILGQGKNEGKEDEGSDNDSKASRSVTLILVKYHSSFTKWSKN